MCLLFKGPSISISKFLYKGRLFPPTKRCTVQTRRSCNPQKGSIKERPFHTPPLLLVLNPFNINPTCHIVHPRPNNYQQQCNPRTEPYWPLWPFNFRQCSHPQRQTAHHHHLPHDTRLPANRSRTGRLSMQVSAYWQVEVSSWHPTFDSLHKANADASIAVGIQEQYAVAYTIELGADLGLSIDSIISLGLSVSVAKTIETAIAESASYTCPPGGWTCALQVLPSVLDVKGHVTHVDIFGTVSGGDYEVTLPRVDHNGNAVAQVTLCACHNRRSWADPGAPPLCPQDCD